MLEIVMNDAHMSVVKHYLDARITLAMQSDSPRRARRSCRLWARI